MQAARERSAAKVRSMGNTVQVKAAQAKNSVTASKEDVPIENYDKLTVEEVSAKLDGLTNEELRQIKAYEKKNQDRVTLGREIDRHMVALPIAGYDKLAVDEIAGVLPSLSAEEIEQVKAYESAHANRVTLMREIDKELAGRK